MNWQCIYLVVEKQMEPHLQLCHLLSTNVFISYWGNVFKVLFATLRASLLEMMLESSLSDLREAQGVALPFCPSLVRLLRLLQDFLFTEGTDNHTLWSEKVYHISNVKHRYRWHILFGLWVIP